MEKNEEKVIVTEKSVKEVFNRLYNNITKYQNKKSVRYRNINIFGLQIVSEVIFKKGILVGKLEKCLYLGDFSLRRPSYLLHSISCSIKNKERIICTAQRLAYLNRDPDKYINSSTGRSRGISLFINRYLKTWEKYLSPEEIIGEIEYSLQNYKEKNNLI